MYLEKVLHRNRITIGKEDDGGGALRNTLVQNGGSTGSLMFVSYMANRKRGFLFEFPNDIIRMIGRTIISNNNLKVSDRLAEISRQAMAQRFCTIECVYQDTDSCFMSSDSPRVWRTVAQVSNFYWFSVVANSDVNLTCAGCESRL